LGGNEGGIINEKTGTGLYAGGIDGPKKRHELAHIVGEVHMELVKRES